jgi:glycosyltransferase involved in cell wall biosynthesis
MMGDVSGPLRVAYTLEQCWHRVPGGTATAAIEVARRLAERPDVELVGVAGRHRRPPAAAFRPPVPIRPLPVARPLLYEAWNRARWPRIEGATGPVDVCHSTTSIPAVTDAPHVVTVHDVAFVQTPERFTRRGARVLAAGLERCRSAELVLVPSRATADDLVGLGFERSAIRVVPWGVDPVEADATEVARVRAAYGLPERFVLFVGTLEPRKNLARLVAAVTTTAERLPLVVAGPIGWGDVGDLDTATTHLVGFVPEADLAPLYAAATVFAYPSLHEGFGLPVAEAMAQGTPVVTSAGTSTEEVAGGAAELVDPTSVSSIASGIDRAVEHGAALSAAGRRRAAELDWSATVDATVAAYHEARARRDGSAA